MTIPPEFETWLMNAGLGTLTAADHLSGGSINVVRRIHLTSGQSLILKVNPGGRPDAFPAEARGLAALAAAAGPRIPEVLTVSPSFLALEDLRPAAPVHDFWDRLGTEMAQLHQVQADDFGFDSDNYLGDAPQPNHTESSGYTFFGQQRLLPQGERAKGAGYLNAGHLTQLDSIVDRLPVLIPVQPASLLHGDLWSGNIMSDSAGLPAIIDPAVHYGWGEADLAMTVLFGSPPHRFFEA